jgi:hypothetical protein
MATAKIPGTTKATIAGLFRDESKAEMAIEELRAAGVLAERNRRCDAS